WPLIRQTWHSMAFLHWRVASEDLRNLLPAEVTVDEQDGDGADGIWFFTLEVDSALTVAVVRPMMGVPYRWATMCIDTSPETVRYRSRRRSRVSGPGHEIVVRHEPKPATPDALDDFLTGRWRGYSRPLGRLVATPVQH